MNLLNKINEMLLRFKWHVILLISIVVMLPYCWAALYVHPFADDWAFAQKLHVLGRIDFIIDFYKHWSGRYFANTLLSLPKSHPEHSLYLYRLLPILFIAFLNFSIYIFIKSLDYTNSKFKPFVLSVFITALTIANFIEPFSALYWNCASFYLPAVSFYLLFLALIVKYYIKNNHSYTIIISILILTFLVSGLVEIFIFANLIIFSTLIIYRYRSTKKIDKLSVAIIFVSFIGIYLSLFASGVGKRMEASHVDYSFLSAAIRAAYDLIIFNILPVITSPVALFFIVFYFAIDSFVNSNVQLKQKLQINPFLSLTIGLFCFYIFHALSIYGAGYSLQGRVQNISQLLFYIFIAFQLMIFSANQKERARNTFESLKVWALCILLFTSLFNLSGRTTIAECVRTLPAFDAEMKNRYTLLINARNNKQDEVEVPRIKTNPKTYYLGTYDKDVNYYNSRSCINEMSFCFKIKVKLEDSLSVSSSE